MLESGPRHLHLHLHPLDAETIEAAIGRLTRALATADDATSPISLPSEHRYASSFACCTRGRPAWCGSTNGQARAGAIAAREKRNWAGVEPTAVILQGPTAVGKSTVKCLRMRRTLPERTARGCSRTLADALSGRPRYSRCSGPKNRARAAYAEWQRRKNSSDFATDLPAAGPRAYIRQAMTYGDLKRKVQDLRAKGDLPTRLTAEERADWAYGNAVIENDNVTPEMAERAVAAELAGE